MVLVLGRCDVCLSIDVETEPLSPALSAGEFDVEGANDEETCAPLFTMAVMRFFRSFSSIRGGWRRSEKRTWRPLSSVHTTSGGEDDVVS